jgi:S1-C subfamily serine protease
MVKANEFLEMYGAKIKNISSSQAAKLRIKGGVEVVSLSNGKFAAAGIKEGFIITGINQQRIYDIQDMKALLQNIKNGGIYIEGIYPNGIEAYYAFGI